MKEDNFITTAELAKILGISRIAVFKKIKKGEINATKSGRNYIISAKSLSIILGKTVSESRKRAITAAVKKTVQEYGEVIKKLGTE
jgi:excisionase family DNA binding protein